jgi:hypothetical protein
MMLDLTLSLISLMIVQVWASAKCVVRPRGDLQDNRAVTRALGDVLREPAIACVAAVDQLYRYTDWDWEPSMLAYASQPAAVAGTNGVAF